MLFAVCALFTGLAELPLVTFDFSCNKVSTIPVCYRRMKHLQSLQLEHNPLQSPPAQVFLQACTVLWMCVYCCIFFFFFRFVWKVKFTYLSIWAWRRVGSRGWLTLSTCLRWSVCLSPPLAGRLLDTRSPTPSCKSAKLVSDVSPCPCLSLFWSSVEDLEQQKKHDSDSGVGSDARDNRLSATEVLTMTVASSCLRMARSYYYCCYYYFTAIRWGQSQHTNGWYQRGG